LTTLKMAVLAPMPSISVTRAIRVKAGWRLSVRHACVSVVVQFTMPTAIVADPAVQLEILRSLIIDSLVIFDR